MHISLCLLGLFLCLNSTIFAQVNDLPKADELLELSPPAGEVTNDLPQVAPPAGEVTNDLPQASPGTVPPVGEVTNDLPKVSPPGAEETTPAEIVEPPIVTSENYQHQIDVMDRMVNELAKSNMTLVSAVEEGEQYYYPPEGWPVFDSEILTDRLGRIRSGVPLQYNSKVASFIKVYTVRKREVTQRALGLSHLYFPMIEEKLDSRDMPLELKYLAIVESALNPHAVSPAGATGLWQIMYRTGKELGLQTDSYVDERRDPERATDAALDYLSKLHRIYGDWLYAIAAYNCGPGNVNKAIRRSGGQKGIWNIWPYLPRETRGYVPAFVAVAYTMNYYEEHQLQAWRPVFEYELIDTVSFTENAPLSLIAEQLGMTEDEIYYYNPELKRKYVPGGSIPYTLKIPFSKSANFIEKEDVIYALAGQQNTPPPVVTVASRANSGTPAPAYFQQPGMTRLEYSIKSGDNLGFISEWYDVGLSELRNWNNIYGNRIRAGQKLVIYKKKEEADRYNKIDGMSFAQKQGMIGKAVSSTPSAGTSTSKQPEVVATTGTFVYTIKSGDNLWDISRKHSGNTVESILKLNGLTKNTKLQPGMKIKLAK